MRHYNAHHNEDGFTLLELMVVMIFVGILAAISAPSFIGLNQRNEVTQDVTNAENALLEAQRGAMRRGKDCTLSFSVSASGEPIISSSSDNCLSMGTRTLYNVSMNIYKDGTGVVSSLTFDYLGNMTETNPITIVLRHKSNTGGKKCIVISQPLGLIATGKYIDPASGTTYSSSCTP
ncbi:type II secretion system protein [Aphanizomenon sp. UHCC 0183]|uniref:type II secretion system protein n=1 Tax=Aphanizomenon sp. UHCC 0183 TaxID=2590028 RepID=UPI0014465BCE|nr:type II secretion system protein [Aphanizomenon sp. UHCC 0183]MTJ31958.1 type II secretion system protein [Aphanizomenon sp. UHCC 0183]